jgi:glycosyltransferase involved in cell wall biosynthesis
VALFTPQWEEPFGLAAVEAMATGLPVAATPHGAVEEVLGEAGVIAVDDTPESLAEALRQALAIPAEVPRARVARLFDAQAMVTKFERLYHAALAQGDVAVPHRTYPAIALHVEGADRPLAEAG